MKGIGILLGILRQRLADEVGRVGPESRDGKAADVRSGQTVHASAPRQR